MVKMNFLCRKIAWIRILSRIRIRIRLLQKGLDPDPYNKYTDPQHCKPVLRIRIRRNPNFFSGF